MKTNLVDRHAKRVEAGVCVRCRAELDGNVQTCPRCAALELTYKKTRRERLDEQELCHYCGKRPAVPDRTRCFECAEARNATWAAHRDFEAAAARSKEARDAARAEGKCGKCLRAEAVEGKTQCEPCFEKDRARSAIRRAEQKKSKLAAAGVVAREVTPVVDRGHETERARRTRVKTEKTTGRRRTLARLAPAIEIKAKMDEHGLSVRDIASLHGIPENVIRGHLATIGVGRSKRNGWQTKNDAKRAALSA